jgi:hypothetical protein
MDDQAIRTLKDAHAAALQEQKAQLEAEHQAQTLNVLYRVGDALRRSTVGDPTDALPNARNQLGEIARAYPFLLNSSAILEVMSCLSGIEELHRDRARLHRVLFLRQRIGEYEGLIAAEAKSLTESQAQQCHTSLTS